MLSVLPKQLEVTRLDRDQDLKRFASQFRWHEWKCQNLLLSPPRMKNKTKTKQKEKKKTCLYKQTV